MLPGGVVDAFAQVQERRLAPLELGEERRRFFDIGNVGDRFGHLVVVGLLDVANDAAVLVPDAVLIDERDALRRRYAASSSTGLGVPHDSLDGAAHGPEDCMGPEISLALSGRSIHCPRFVNGRGTTHIGIRRTASGCGVR